MKYSSVKKGDEILVPLENYLDPPKDLVLKWRKVVLTNFTSIGTIEILFDDGLKAIIEIN